jgi:hypothetical protein
VSPEISILEEWITESIGNWITIRCTECGRPLKLLGPVEDVTLRLFPEYPRLCNDCNNSNANEWKGYRAKCEMIKKVGVDILLETRALKSAAGSGKAPPIGLEPMTNWLTARRST